MVGVAVGVSEGVGVIVGVSVAVGDGVAVAVGVAEVVGVGVNVTVAVEVVVGVAVAVEVAVLVGVADGVPEGVPDGRTVGVFVLVGGGVHWVGVGPRVALGGSVAVTTPGGWVGVRVGVRVAPDRVGAKARAPRPRQ